MAAKPFSNRRRTLIKAAAAMIALRPAAAFAALSCEDTVALLEPVRIPRNEFVDGNKIVEFEGCKVLLERHPQAVVDRLGTDIEIPGGPILFCPCHFYL